MPAYSSPSTALNSNFRQFAQMFLGRAHVDQDIPFAEALDRASLDGSIESLAAVDQYLAHVQSHLASLTDKQRHDLVLRCGAYLGECIRMTWPEDYDWTDDHDFVPWGPSRAKPVPAPEPAPAAAKDATGGSAFLVRRPGEKITPMDHVLRCLSEGPGQTVQAFAESERQFHA